MDNKLLNFIFMFYYIFIFCYLYLYRDVLEIVDEEYGWCFMIFLFVIKEMGMCVWYKRYYYVGCELLYNSM